MQSESYRKTPRWIFIVFMIYTAVVFVTTVLGAAVPDLVVPLSGVPVVLGFASFVALLVVRWRSTDVGLEQIGLSLGAAREWLAWGLAFVIFYASQTGLNALFGLGYAVDVTPLAESSGMPSAVLLVVSFVQSVIFSPVVIALFMAFGEEYGWRGYLQGELVKLGKVKGVFLVGLVWGLWHVPAILLGHNYPGQPVLGSLLMVAYSILLGFVLGHVMLKTRAIWLVAFLHALNNHVFQYLTGLVYAPDNAVLSFSGTGVYSLIILAGIAALLLRDPVWRD